ncbi:MAG: hypothetical protein IT287_00540 [Bdellovibrionaceae bacterium]|nr:hypothetical protein [Pseudobdellovibrionaceae bacterium]
MKSLATFFATLTLLTFYIALVAGPISYYLQKKNVLSHKITLLFLYVMIGFAVFLSLFSPEITFVSNMVSAFGDTHFGSYLLSVKADTFQNLQQVIGTEATFYRYALTALAFIGAIGLMLYVLSIIAIVLKIKSLPIYKRYGRLILLTEKRNVTPHVFSLFGKSYIVVPKSVIKEKTLYRTAVQHELQHIRNGDTQNVYLLQLLKCFLWVNPAIHILHAQIKNLQELRVDENLIHERKISYKTYLQTLNWFIGNSSTQSHFSLSYSIFGWSTFRELKKRVQNIHRVRPMRTQPIVCAALFIINIFSLLFIANSSPRFNYSLYEIQRMFMPRYMKKEFTIHVKNRSELRATREMTTVHTLSLLEEVEVRYAIVTDKQMKRVKERDGGAGPVMLMRDDDGVVSTMKFYYPIIIKALEYGDDHIVINIAGRFSDEKELNPIKDSKSKTRPHIKGQSIRLVYGETIEIDDFDIALKVVKELVSPQISYQKNGNEKSQWLANL